MLSKSSNLVDPITGLVFDHWLNYTPAEQVNERINHSAHLCTDHAQGVPVHRLNTLFHSFGTCDVVGCEQPDEYSYDFNGVKKMAAVILCGECGAFGEQVELSGEGGYCIKCGGDQWVEKEDLNNPELVEYVSKAAANCGLTVEQVEQLFA